MKKLLLSALSCMMIMVTNHYSQAQECKYGNHSTTSSQWLENLPGLAGHVVTITEPTVINTLYLELNQDHVNYGTGEGRFIIVKRDLVSSVIASPRFSYSSAGLVAIDIADVTLDAGNYILYTYVPGTGNISALHDTRFNNNATVFSYVYDADIYNYLNQDIDADLTSYTPTGSSYSDYRFFNFAHVGYTERQEFELPICSPSYTFNGVEYTESTTVAERIIGTNGDCDTLVLTHLNFVDNNLNQSVVECGSFTWPINGETYTESDVIVYNVGTTMYGCDSTVTLNLTINQSPIMDVELDGHTLTLTATEGTFQWVDCNEDFAVVEDATAQSFTPERTGSYAAEITLNGCVFTTECTQVDYLGLDNVLKNDWTVLPNPTNGLVTISFGSDVALTSVELYSVNGQLIETIAEAGTVTQMSFNLTQNAGVYLLKITTNEGAKTIRVVKQ